jgi:hypothetical protein
MTNGNAPRLHVEDPAQALPWAMATLSRLEANLDLPWPPPVGALWSILEGALDLAQRRLAAVGPALIASRMIWLGLTDDIRRQIAALPAGLDLEGEDYFATVHDLPPEPLEALIENARPAWQACQNAIAAFQKRLAALGQESLTETGALALHAVLLQLTLAEREDSAGLHMVPVVLELLGRSDLFRKGAGESAGEAAGEAAGPSCPPK